MEKKIDLEADRPKCGYCGRKMIESLFYRGGRGYGWAWHCPAGCETENHREGV